LKVLEDLGFTQRKRNQKLLTRCGGNLQLVQEFLLASAKFKVNTEKFLITLQNACKEVRQEEKTSNTRDMELEEEKPKKRKIVEPSIAEHPSFEWPNKVDHLFLGTFSFV
jgi:hypothetical protein